MDTTKVSSVSTNRMPVESARAQPLGEVFRNVSISGKIGKTADDHNPATARLSVHVPLGAQINDIKAYFANQPWGAGESEYSPTAFTETPIIGLNGQAYAEWTSGWARCKLIEVGSNDHSQYVIVDFETWKHDNSRNGKLEVDYSNP